MKKCARVDCHFEIISLSSLPVRYTFQSNLSLGFICSNPLCLSSKMVLIWHSCYYMWMISGESNGQWSKFSGYFAFSIAHSVFYEGPGIFFLGILVEHTAHGMLLSQSKYALDLLDKAGMTNCKPYSTPSCSAKDDDQLPFDNPTLYRSLVGGLQYLMLTRYGLRRGPSCWS